VGIFIACPLKDPLESCPFKKIHSMSMKGKVEELLLLKEEEAEALLEYAKSCCYFREAGDLEAIGKLESPWVRNGISVNELSLLLVARWIRGCSFLLQLYNRH